MDNEKKEQSDNSRARLNSLRAAVLGANDGIVSVAGIVVGVAGATTSSAIIFTAGLAGLAAGALSMATGEYISVSSQRDSERMMIEREKQEHIDYPEEELLELEEIYEKKGLSKKTAKIVAQELTKNDALAAHLDAELAINPDDLTNPWHAAIASCIAFLCGAIIPLLTVVIAPHKYRVPITFSAVILALILTGILSAIAGGSGKLKSTVRVVIGGALAMAITYTIGKIVGINV